MVNSQLSTFNSQFPSDRLIAAALESLRNAKALLRDLDEHTTPAFLLFMRYRDLEDAIADYERDRSAPQASVVLRLTRNLDRRVARLTPHQ